MNLKVCALLAMAVSVSGCASYVRGTNENVTVETRPSRAAVRLSLGDTCPRSPCTFKVPRRKAFTAYATKPGYKPGQVQVASKFSKAGTLDVAGDLIFPGGSVAAVVDVVDGAALDHTPNPAVIVLQPAHGGKAVVRKAPARAHVMRRHRVPVS